MQLPIDLSFVFMCTNIFRQSVDDILGVNRKNSRNTLQIVNLYKS